MGVPLEGRFKKFDAQLDFDPKKPENGKVSFTIELGSASLGDAAVAIGAIEHAVTEEALARGWRPPLTPPLIWRFTRG